MPSITVLTMVSSRDLNRSGRWLDCVIEALSASTADEVLGPWRVIVGTYVGDEDFDERSAEVYLTRATVAGGALEFRAVDARSETAIYAQLIEVDDSDLFLIVAPESIILTSTLERLINADRAEGRPIAARELPIERDGLSCVLVDRAFVQSGKLDALDRDLLANCPDAAVFLDDEATVAGRSGDISRADEGDVIASLLEEAISPLEMLDARRIVAESFAGAARPLLSIVMRTQGRRTEPLRDVLLCLAGQLDDRFELLIVVHDADPEAPRGVLEEQPWWLRQRTKLLVASGGTRSRPLNVGLAEASGSHIAFLDDDDLVFADWVAGFLSAAKTSPHRVLRASAGVQHVTTAVWPGGTAGHAVVSSLTTPYPATFDLADHLRVNMTPFMAFAFPRSFFALFGGADESLRVCEDWDLVLRAASVLGVTDVPRLTAIYRRWDSGRDSYSTHDRVEWDQDMAAVRAKLETLPLLLPPGAASELAELSAARGAQTELAAAFSSSSWRITAPLRALSARTRRRDARGGGPGDSSAPS